MVDVYRNAYFTISAACASDSRDGFLGDRKLTSVIKGTGPIYLPYRTAAGIDGPIGTVGLVKNSMRGFTKDPIHSRAWTMQEHFLAPRILVYGSVQLFCICGSKTLHCGDQYSLGNRMDRRQWKRTHSVLCAPKKKDARIQQVELPTSPEQLVQFETVLYMMPMLLDSITERPQSDFDKNPLEKLILDMVLCRLVAEIGKLKNGELDQQAAEGIYEMIQTWVKRWSLHCGHKNLQELGDQAKQVVLSTWALIRAPSSCYAEDFAQFPHIWKAIVEEFTSRRLSYNTDKLPALAAIAEVAGSLGNDKYVAGLWKKYLLPQLLWRVSDPATAFRPLNDDSAHHPTWSWTSVNGQVDMWPFFFEHPAGKPIAQVLECDTELVHNIVPYGRLKSTKLVIRGWLQPITLGADGKTANLRRRTTKNDGAIDIQLDHLSERANSDTETISKNPNEKIQLAATGFANSGILDMTLI
ncbi:hypothetical protein N0V90_004012 [Kalmusia sp. IMI 367209]|nr:hypothetical protein N0V90_004012 [Kalmusia sp. IMI 367209]